jgi:phenylpropionate dioxygenase-like ring-hydroxylating dioxygenase large terminal subunit
MLTHEQNETLTRTGPGTPMGELFRRYWIPVLLADELPAPDCPPVRVKLLGERLVAFRDSSNRLGLVDEFCAHRGVSLWFGRNEEGGLRCPYHGWKYDVEGRCLEVPSEPAASGFCERIRLKSYALAEHGGLLWAYMGPPNTRPPLPELEFATVPASQRFVSKRLQECNYLQAMEGGIDSSHVSFLHRFNLHNDSWLGHAKSAQYLADTRPVFEVVPSDGGLLIGARRDAEEGRYYWRVTQWIMPWYTIIPPFGTASLGGHAWVPIDDENCWTFSMNWHPTRALTEQELAPMRAGKGIHCELIPGTFRPRANRDNDYLMDRSAQLEGRSFSGVDGISLQDSSIQESMGPIQDRTKEHLVSTDNGIIMARQRLLKAARALAEKGVLPPGNDPAHQRVRSASLVLPQGLAFKEGAREALIAHPDQAPVSV